MRLEMEHRHLALSNRHIRESRERISAQRVRVARMQRDGEDTALSLQLLGLMENGLQIMLSHRALILAEIDRLTHTA